MAVLLRKSFCSWICPVGLLSESLARVGQRMFGRNFRFHSGLDISLRGVKYLLLGFFLWAIFTMDAQGLRAFIESPYNRVSDVKMYLFFAEIGPTAAVVIGALAIGSIFVQGAWCRYVCPYGALLGLFSWMSPVKVRRDDGSCTDCGLCDRTCMARLPVSRKAAIHSVECTGCLDCVSVCPVAGTLTMGSRRVRIRATVYALAVVVLFLVGYSSARMADVWQNQISDTEYIERITHIDDPAYGHPGRSENRTIDNRQ